MSRKPHPRSAKTSGRHAGAPVAISVPAAPAAPDAGDGRFDGSIAARTLKCVVGLTLACVLFVALASALSLFLVHRALGPSGETAAPTDIPPVLKKSTSKPPQAI